ncbi:hypothetical protein AP071_16860 [Rhodobacter capsulatus]|nr:hypothetical protein AP071_16860 [Rhodobacter capsulatus]
MADLAAGRTDALIGDFPGTGERAFVARSIFSAARAHPGMGLILREAERAKERMRKGDWESG